MAALSLLVLVSCGGNAGNKGGNGALADGSTEVAAASEKYQAEFSAGFAVSEDFMKVADVYVVVLSPAECAVMEKLTSEGWNFSYTTENLPATLEYSVSYEPKENVEFDAEYYTFETRHFEYVSVRIGDTTEFAHRGNLTPTVEKMSVKAADVSAYIERLAKKSSPYVLKVNADGTTD